MLRVGLLLLVVAVPTVARADILMWRDASGVRHYTNLKKLVPAQADASIVLEDIVVPAAVEAAPAAAPSAPDPQPPPRMAEVVYDQNALADAYAEGWRRGMATVQQNQATGGVSVQINGPLSIDASAPAVYTFGGLRTTWTAHTRVAFFVDGGGGVAHGTSAIEARAGSTDVSSSVRAALRIKHSETRGLVTVGGGVFVPLTGRLGLDLGYRYMRIFTEDPRIDTGTMSAAVRWGRASTS